MLEIIKIYWGIWEIGDRFKGLLYSTLNIVPHFSLCIMFVNTYFTSLIYLELYINYRARTKLYCITEKVFSVICNSTHFFFFKSDKLG